MQVPLEDAGLTTPLINKEQKKTSVNVNTGFRCKKVGGEGSSRGVDFVWRSVHFSTFDSSEDPSSIRTGPGPNALIPRRSPRIQKLLAQLGGPRRWMFENYRRNAVSLEA
jgi:hypothetical protein